jgi:Tfp pilus assembly protein PilO
MAMSARDRRAVVFGGAALALMAVYVLVLAPAVRGYRDLVSEHGAADRAVKRYVDDQRKAVVLAARVKEWEAKAGEFAPPKPYGEQMTAVGERIVAAAQESGVNLQGTTPGTPTPWPDDAKVAYAPIQIEAQAGFENVYKFLAALYRIPGVISVEQMDLTGEGKGGDNLKARISISVLVAPASVTPWAS